MASFRLHGICTFAFQLCNFVILLGSSGEISTHIKTITKHRAFLVLSAVTCRLSTFKVIVARNLRAISPKKMDEHAHLPLDAHPETEAIPSHPRLDEQRTFQMWQETSSADSLALQALYPMQLPTKAQSLCVADRTNHGRSLWATSSPQGHQHPSNLSYARPVQHRPHTVHGAGSFHAAVDQCNDMFAPELSDRSLEHLPTYPCCARSDPPSSHDAFHTAKPWPFRCQQQGSQGLHERKNSESAQADRSPTGRCQDFAFLDTPSVPSMSMGYPTHRFGSPNLHAAVSEDPLMQPLPQLDSATSLSPTKRLSLSLSAEGHSDSQSPNNAVHSFDRPADKLLPLVHPLPVTVDASQQHQLSEHVVGSALCAPQYMCNVQRSLLATQSLVDNTKSSDQREPQSTGCTAAQHQPSCSGLHAPTSHKPSDMSVSPTRSSFARSSSGVTGRGNRNISVPSRSAPPATAATHTFAATDAFSSPLSGYDAVERQSLPSSLPRRLHADNRHVPITREHSLRMLHSSLCNVGSVSELGSMGMDMAVHKPQSSGTLSLLGKCFLATLYWVHAPARFRGAES